MLYKVIASRTDEVNLWDVVKENPLRVIFETVINPLLITAITMSVSSDLSQDTKPEKPNLMAQLVQMVVPAIIILTYHYLCNENQRITANKPERSHLAQIVSLTNIVTGLFLVASLVSRPTAILMMARATSLGYFPTTSERPHILAKKPRSDSFNLLQQLGTLITANLTGISYNQLMIPLTVLDLLITLNDQVYILPKELEKEGISRQKLRKFQEAIAKCEPADQEIMQALQKILSKESNKYQQLASILVTVLFTLAMDPVVRGQIFSLFKQDPTVTAAYETLGLPQNANFTVVKKAYLELARENHPDKKCKLTREECTEMFLAVAAAKERLEEWLKGPQSLA